jgi:hypothetical protein
MSLGEAATGTTSAGGHGVLSAQSDYDRVGVLLNNGPTAGLAARHTTGPATTPWGGCRGKVADVPICVPRFDTEDDVRW